MANLNVQIGHVNGKSGAPHEEKTLKLIVPNIESRLREAGHKVTHFDGSLQSQSANHQYGGDGTIFCHCDSNGAGDTFSIGYWEDEHPGSGVLAVILRDTYKQLGIRWNNFNITGGEWHYYGNRRFAHSCKCCLIECGFVSNPTQRAWLQTNAQKVGNTIADAYIKYFGGQSQPQPKPTKEDTMIYAVVDFKEDVPQDGRHVYVAAEGWWDLPDKRANTYLIIKNESDKVANIEVTFTPHSGVFTYAIPPKNDEKSRWELDLVTKAPKNGFATTVKSDVSIVPQISILGDKK